MPPTRLSLAGTESLGGQDDPAPLLTTDDRSENITLFEFKNVVRTASESERIAGATSGTASPLERRKGIKWQQRSRREAWHAPVPFIPAG